MGYVRIFLLEFRRQAERAGPRLYGKSWIQRLEAPKLQVWTEGPHTWVFTPTLPLSCWVTPGEVTLALLATAPSFVSFGGLGSYPLLGF